MPYTETSFSQAIFQMFENLDTYLEKNYDDLPQEAVKVSLYLVSAVDIAVSKLGRFESVDREDIMNLFQNNMFTIEDFRETAEEAKKYCGVATDKLEFSINMAIDILKEEGQWI